MKKTFISNGVRNLWYKLRYGRTYDDFMDLGEALAEANRQNEIKMSRIEKQYRIYDEGYTRRQAKRTLHAIKAYYPDLE